MTVAQSDLESLRAAGWTWQAIADHTNSTIRTLFGIRHNEHTPRRRLVAALHDLTRRTHANALGGLQPGQAVAVVGPQGNTLTGRVRRVGVEIELPSGQMICRDALCFVGRNAEGWLR